MSEDTIETWELERATALAQSHLAPMLGNCALHNIDFGLAALILRIELSKAVLEAGGAGVFQNHLEIEEESLADLMVEEEPPEAKVEEVH